MLRACSLKCFLRVLCALHDKSVHSAVDCFFVDSFASFALCGKWLANPQEPKAKSQ
jgi:hypothetical protein